MALKTDIYYFYTGINSSNQRYFTLGSGLTQGFDYSITIPQNATKRSMQVLETEYRAAGFTNFGRTVNSTYKSNAQILEQIQSTSTTTFTGKIGWYATFTGSAPMYVYEARMIVTYEVPDAVSTVDQLKIINVSAERINNTSISLKYSLQTNVSKSVAVAVQYRKVGTTTYTTTSYTAVTVNTTSSQTKTLTCSSFSDTDQYEIIITATSDALTATANVTASPSCAMHITKSGYGVGIGTYLTGDEGNGSENKLFKCAYPMQIKLGDSFYTLRIGTTGADGYITFVL